ncbi:hypothetical protein DX933_02455 [Ornithinibacillus gellani]|nr:hypothetical protein DX933_02455 [Ornithinibacillus gellani]
MQTASISHYFFARAVQNQFNWLQLIIRFKYIKGFTKFYFFHRLTGCKAPTLQKFLFITRIVRGATASKGLIGSTNNQWESAKTPTD